MIPVQAILPAALAGILRKAPLTPDKVAFAWRSAVGSAVDGATTIDLRDGILHVHAKDAAWQREIERAAAVIRPRLDAVLGAGVIRYIDVTAESSSSSAAARSAPAAAASASAPPAAPSAGAPGSGSRNR